MTCESPAPSRSPLSPRPCCPANPSTAAPTGPAVGASCHGYQINSRAQAADGTTLVCNNYRWEVYSGQTGDSPWLRGQREWTDCIARNTEEYCRATLNRG